MISIVVGAVAVAALGGYLYWKSRPEKEEEIHHTNCPSCGRRLRYRTSQAGRQVLCPLCRKPMTFPALPTTKE